jgi:hypothetical protein
MKKTLANGVTREPLPTICIICGFEVPRHQAVEFVCHKLDWDTGTISDVTQWRHQALQLCDRLIEQKALSDKLLGVTHEP